MGKRTRRTKLMKFAVDFWQDVLDYRDKCERENIPITVDGIMDEFNLSNRIASGIYQFIDNVEFISEAMIPFGPSSNIDTDRDCESCDEYENGGDCPSDAELVAASVKYKKQTQRFSDINRVERKSFREFARVENALVELDRELLQVLSNHQIFPDIQIITNPQNIKMGAVGIVHLTDLHFNELVDIAVNKYDFKVASKRLKKFISAAIKYFKTENIDNVFVAMTGDLLNNDNLLDKILNQASNRAKAIFLAHKLLSQAFIELMQHFQLTVAGVTGNETRIKGDVTFDTNISSDNFDFMLYNMLHATFGNCKRISFVGGHDTETVVSVAGQNVLLIHGHQKKIMSGVTSGVQQIIGKYAQRGIIIDFVMFGHLHEAYIADIFARSSSMVGANAYSEDGLQLASRASQNLHIFYADGSRNTIRVDLQYTDDIIGYTIDEELESYNAKSVDKLHEKETIFQIVI
jgi:predicted phosphodiesterase